MYILYCQVLLDLSVSQHLLLQQFTSSYSVLILVMYYKKFKFLCINLENGICALKM